MPCYFLECSRTEEAKRFAISFVGLYVYHFVWDKAVITPIVNYLIRTKRLPKDKKDKMRESLWKNAAVGTFFLLGIYIGHDKDWWMNPKGYFIEWPYNAPEILRWYYMIYLSFWFQSIDFMLNITNTHYKVKRKDNAEMLIHHFATIMLMLFSYLFDMTRVGMCVLMIHDVNDLLLESAKVFVYLEGELIANILFGLFAIVWYIVRWGFYGYNILYSVYGEAYVSMIIPIQKAGGYGGLAPDTWYWIWLGFFSFLGLLFILHLFWGYLIGKMVIKTLSEGNVEKDIRSDSEAEDAEDESEKEADKSTTTPPSSTDNKVKRRRAPKAE